MKTKIFIFFALVSCFRAFADCQSDKDYVLDKIANIEWYTSLIEDNAGEVVRLGGYHSDGAFVRHGDYILSYANSLSYNSGILRGLVDTIDCSNTTCSVDLGPLATVVSNIYDVVSSEYAALTNLEEHLMYIRSFTGDIDSALSPQNANSLVGSSFFSPDYWVNVKYPQLFYAVSNFNNDVSYSLGMVTNSINSFQSSFVAFKNSYVSYQTTYFQWLDSIVMTLETINDNFLFIYDFMDSMNTAILNIDLTVSQYLPYLQTISEDLKLISTNSAFSVDQAYTNMFRYSNLLGFDRFRYYAQGQLKNTQVSLYPLSPYDTLQNLRNATIYDAVAAGFESLLISQGSINNYLYWLQAVAGSNRLSVVDSHIMAISNMVYRLDDYVLNDFSNEIASISYKLSFVTNQVDYTTNLVEITNLLQTNNNHLASIDSKLDVLDYIKILSDTPLADYSGDIDYFDYLTNLYLSGVSSSGASTNWFERMEILLASLVFGDSDGTNDIPQSVEMEGFDTDRVSDTMSDFAFSEDFSTSVDNLSQTSRNFMQVLNGYSSALHAVSAPATVSIGTGGIDGSDTSSFEDMMHGHFQVSFNTGTSDRFTVVVRAVTTMSWVLLTMIFIWHCGFWILQKIQFLYRLMRLLINSIWLKS